MNRLIILTLLLPPLATVVMWGMSPTVAFTGEPMPIVEPTVVLGRDWRGVYFNPQVAGAPWLLRYDAHRAMVQRALCELNEEAGINLVDVQVLIPHSLRVPAQGNRVGERVEEWANTTFLDNIARFVDDCHAAGIAVELDLVDNRWLPATVDPDAHIGKPGNPWWPQPDATPWDEAAEWYATVIRHVETRAAHPEAIAMWCPIGNYQVGAAEPVVWDNAARPEIGQYTEQFIKAVWPVFRATGKRPKAAPILFPIFAADDRLGSSTGSPISSRRRGSIGIATTGSSRQITRCGRPSRRWRSGTSASSGMPRRAGMSMPGTMAAIAAAPRQRPAPTTPPGLRGRS